MPNGWREAAATAAALPDGVEDAYEGAFFAGPLPAGTRSNHGVLVGQLAGEIKRSLDFFRSTYGNWAPEKVVLSGAGARWPDLTGLLADELAMDVGLPGGIKPAQGDSSVPDPALVTACGLAMGGVKL